jgi:hypothetical protein
MTTELTRFQEEFEALTNLGESLVQLLRSHGEVQGLGLQSVIRDVEQTRMLLGLIMTQLRHHEHDEDE